MPLTLAQAAAVIAAQHLSYATYLDRLRRLPAADLLVAEEAGQYPQGIAAAVLLSLDAVRTGEDGGTCTLAARERVLGPDHPDTLTSRNNLANAYRAADRTDEASDLKPQPSNP